jgi:hypothetical protein
MTPAQIELCAQHLEKFADAIRKQDPTYSLKDLSASAGVAAICVDLVVKMATDATQFTEHEAYQALWNEGKAVLGY